MKAIISYETPLEQAHFTAKNNEKDMFYKENTEESVEGSLKYDVLDAVGEFKGQAQAHPHAEQQKSIFSRPSFVTTFDVLV
ncbi:hypothetical protein [Bacillus wiedmannii]|uniref:Uncharacterized protein n=1 Tax=Bacillus wiedmannii TaxID=1890302 RepID=A0A2C4HY27_9BACI|nr:hypothetical protein [Bacillus wiedmannii]PEJ07079.1 hypothetical protein CN684_17385 [Bacillus wiedmannii]PHC71456.1 hypothetical protein COF35_02275 [Bacillus wiedmannii]